MATPMDSWDNRSKARLGPLAWAIAMAVGVLLIGLVLALAERAKEAPALRNAWQITMALKIFANDSQGLYPDSMVDPLSTNLAFRLLFKEDVIADERVFGCPSSPFVPDGRIGSAPNYDQAVEAGENHWMMVGKLSTSSDGRLPLLYENAVDAAWPPKWHDGIAPKAVRGRCWPLGRVVVAFNDTTVRMVSLEKMSPGVLTLPQSIQKAEKAYQVEELRPLDVEEKRPARTRETEVEKGALL